MKLFGFFGWMAVCVLSLAQSSWAAPGVKIWYHSGESDYLTVETSASIDVFDPEFGGDQVDRFCYYGSASTAEAVLQSMLRNSDLIDDYGRLVEIHDENDIEIENYIELIISEDGEVYLDLDYSFPDELGYSFNITIERCS